MGIREDHEYRVDVRFLLGIIALLIALMGGGAVVMLSRINNNLHNILIDVQVITSQNHGQ